MSVFQRAQCSICTELFDASAAISAVPCGHTFHDHCVTRWLQESETCPQCRQPCKRNRVIHRLYFNQSGDVTDAGDGGDADVARLQNELDEACAKVKQRDSEKADQRAENRRLVTAREHLQVALSALESTCRQQKEASSSLRQELRLQKQLQQDAQAAVDEAKTLREKLSRLRAVSDIIDGEEEKVREMIASQGDPRQLSLWCAVLQQELMGKRREARQSRVTVERLRHEGTACSAALARRAAELATARDQLGASERELAACEERAESGRRKLAALERALGSPSASAAHSFARRLLHESPAPAAPSPGAMSTPVGAGGKALGAAVPLAKRPRLTEESAARLNETLPDLFPELDSPAKESRAARCKDDEAVQTVRITSAAAAKGKRKPDDAAATGVDFENFNLFRRKMAPVDTNSMLRKGYNGMGGHGRFVQPAGKAQRTAPKISSISNTFANLKKPPLPSMSNLLKLDP